MARALILAVKKKRKGRFKFEPVKKKFHRVEEVFSGHRDLSQKNG